MKPYFFVLGLAAICCTGCAPLAFKIFVSNTSATAARVTIRTTAPAVRRQGAVRVRSMSARTITNRSLHELNDSLTAMGTGNALVLELPAHTTAYITDMVYAADRFGDNVLLIDHDGKTDSTNFSYPYRRNLKGFGKKRDRRYNWIYRTLLFYRITD